MKVIRNRNKKKCILWRLSLENEINKTSTSEDEDEDHNTVINNLEVLHDLDSKKIQSDIVIFSQN